MFAFSRDDRYLAVVTPCRLDEFQSALPVLMVDQVDKMRRPGSRALNLSE
jgi:hypothetical protein